MNMWHYPTVCRATTKINVQVSMFSADDELDIYRNMVLYSQRKKPDLEMNDDTTDTDDNNDEMDTPDEESATERTARVRHRCCCHIVIVTASIFGTGRVHSFVSGRTHGVERTHVAAARSEWHPFSASIQQVRM
jgi:hypothetical protein